MNERKSVKKSLALGLIVFLVMVFGMTGSAFAAGETVEVKLPITQVFTTTGTDAAIDENVTYELVSNEPGNPMPAASEITVDGTDDTLGFAITFNHAGVYTYTLKPVLPQQIKTGYTYDTIEYTVQAIIRNTDNGLYPMVEVKPAKLSSGVVKLSSAIYSHSYAPLATDPSLMTDPPVKKIVSGDTPAKAEEFEFTLTAEKNTNPMPDGATGGSKTITVAAGQEKEFGLWEYTAAGTYIYTISEVNTGIEGYTYDTTLYTMTDVVKDEGGQLVLERMITNGDGSPTDVVVYTNVYKAAEQTVVPVAQGKDGPKTGDDTNIMGLVTIIVIAAIALIGCILFFIIRKRREDEEKKNEVRC